MNVSPKLIAALRELEGNPAFRVVLEEMGRMAEEASSRVLDLPGGGTPENIGFARALRWLMSLFVPSQTDGSGRRT